MKKKIETFFATPGELGSKFLKSDYYVFNIWRESGEFQYQSLRSTYIFRADDQFKQGREADELRDKFDREVDSALLISGDDLYDFANEFIARGWFEKIWISSEDI